MMVVATGMGLEGHGWLQGPAGNVDTLGTCLANASCMVPSIITLNFDKVGSNCRAADSRCSGM